MIRHHIDQPLSWEFSQSQVIVSGWCVIEGSAKLTAVRAKGDGWTTEGVFGLERPDVAASHCDVSESLRSGFELHLQLQRGANRLRIEAKDDRDKWHLLEENEARLEEKELCANLDTPVSLTHVEGPIRFSGWCVHSEQRIQYLTLSVNGQQAYCEMGLERPDVADIYADIPFSLKSGFESTIPLKPGVGKVLITAVLENGHEVTQLFISQFRVTAQPLWTRLKKFTVNIYSFIKNVIWLADQRKKRLGRGPRLHEWRILTRELLYAVRSWRNTETPKCAPAYDVPNAQDVYDQWLSVNQWNTKEEKLIRQRFLKLEPNPPLISVVMPVYNPEITFLDRAIETLVEQIYPHWELCIADDASTNPDVAKRLDHWKRQDHRIHVVYRDENGNISKATNSAAELATGSHILFFDQDDELTPNALAEVALYIDEHPDTDIVYSDDDKIDAFGKRFDPQFKPDWSPELLRAYMYFSHLFCVRTSLFMDCQGFRVGFEGSQDYDFALRATERARSIGHIPKILYHWRALPGSTAYSADEKPLSIVAGKKAVEEAWQRSGLQARVIQPKFAEQARLGIFAPIFPDTGPSVSIIIPTKNQKTMLKRCLDSLAITSYENYQIVVIDNQSDDPQTLEYLESLQHRVVTIANPGDKFSFAYINNQAVEHADSELILFLNDDTEAIERRWLSQMVGWIQQEGVGAVGAYLLFPDDRVQHAGIVHGYYQGLAGPAFRLASKSDNGYLSYARVSRNYSAVTAACLLTRKDTFLKFEGFNEQRFAVAFNDVDYCYRLSQSGLRCVYCPDATLIHHEGRSRGFADNPAETAYFKMHYANKVDPYYNPNLSLVNERFQIQPRRPNNYASAPIPTLMCAFNLNWEGAPYSQFELTVKLRDLGVIDPIVYCPEDGPLREAYENAGIKIEVFEHPLARVSTSKEYEQAIQLFAQKIGDWRVELVYGNTLETFYAIDAAATAGKPSLWNPRESEPWSSYFSNWPEPIAERALRCFTFPYRVVFVANATRDVYQPLNTHHNFCVIHNGLNLEQLKEKASHFPRSQARESLGLKQDEILILLLGTVCERKNQKDLVNALSQLAEDDWQHIQCRIVGDRPSIYSKELHQLVDSLHPKLKKRISIVKETPETARFYAAADVFVCTSRIESFPRVILEAMAYQLPIITTPAFGIVEQVQEEVNALFYEVDNPSSLAKGLSRLIQDSALRQRFSMNSRAVLNILNDFESMSHAYGELFKEAWLAGFNADVSDGTGG